MQIYFIAIIFIASNSKTDLEKDNNLFLEQLPTNKNHYYQSTPRSHSSQVTHPPAHYLSKTNDRFTNFQPQTYPLLYVNVTVLQQEGITFLLFSSVPAVFYLQECIFPRKTFVLLFGNENLLLQQTKSAPSFS